MKRSDLSIMIQFSQCNSLSVLYSRRCVNRLSMVCTGYPQESVSPYLCVVCVWYRLWQFLCKHVAYIQTFLLLLCTSKMEQYAGKSVLFQMNFHERDHSVLCCFCQQYSCTVSSIKLFFDDTFSLLLEVDFSLVSEVCLLLMGGKKINLLQQEKKPFNL